VGLGEAANFAAYSFAPAILVTPLGALSVVIRCGSGGRAGGFRWSGPLVLIGLCARTLARLVVRSPSAVLAAIFLNERMDRAGKIGCGLCMIGSVIIVMHAPPERELASVNDVINYMVQPRTAARNRPGRSWRDG